MARDSTRRWGLKLSQTSIGFIYTNIIVENIYKENTPFTKPQMIKYLEGNLIRHAQELYEGAKSL